METTLRTCTILEEGPLRISLEVTLQISDKSYIRQVIGLEADSPYISIDCEVSIETSVPHIYCLYICS